IEHPVLLAEEMAALRRAGGAELTTLSATWEAAAGPEELSRALEQLAQDAVAAVRRGGGATILVISDRDAGTTRAPIPMRHAIGLGPQIIDRRFTGTASVIGGVGCKEIAEDVLTRHQSAGALPDHGRVRYRRDGEDHGWSPPVVRALQHGEYTGFVAATRAR